MNSQRMRKSKRGVVAVEAAIVLPLLLILMFGVWEVGRIVEVQQLLINSAREGARVASGASVNGTKVKVSDVQQAVRDYLTSSGFPAAAVSGAEITLTNKSSHSWTDPADAKPLDPFDVKVRIPPGAAFKSLEWHSAHIVTSITELSVTVRWLSMRDAQVVVDASVPL